MKFFTEFEYFPLQGSGNIKSGNSFHKFHMPYALIQDPLFMYSNEDEMGWGGEGGVCRLKIHKKCSLTSL
jgi:hypothetical protein